MEKGGTGREEDDGSLRATPMIKTLISSFQECFVMFSKDFCVLLPYEPQMARTVSRPAGRPRAFKGASSPPPGRTVASI